MEEGASMSRGEVAVRVRGHYLQLAPQVTTITGILAAASGWATAARALVDSASPLPVGVSAPLTLYPNAFRSFEHSAVVGGCVGSDSPWQVGLTPRPLILLLGDTLRAAQAFGQMLQPEVPHMVRVDTFFDEADEAVRVALAFGDTLTGVVLEAENERNEISSDLLMRVRHQLDLAGFPRVKLFVDGDVMPEAVTRWKDEQAPIDGFYAGESLAVAPPIPFTTELKETDGRPIARRGLTPGTTPNLRMKK